MLTLHEHFGYLSNRKVGNFCIDHNICDALDVLVPFVQFKKREKPQWRIAEARNFTKNFYVLKILQMVPNGAKQNTYTTDFTQEN